MSSFSRGRGYRGLKNERRLFRSHGGSNEGESLPASSKTDAPIIALDKRFQILSSEQERAMAASEMRSLRTLAQQNQARNQTLFQARNRPVLSVPYAPINDPNASILGRPDSMDLGQGFSRHTSHGFPSVPPPYRGILPLPESQSILGNPFREAQQPMPYYSHPRPSDNARFSGSVLYSGRGRGLGSWNYRGRAGGRGRGGESGRGRGGRGDASLTHDKLDKDIESYMLNADKSD